MSHEELVDFTTPRRIFQWFEEQSKIIDAPFQQVTEEIDDYAFEQALLILSYVSNTIPKNGADSSFQKGWDVGVGIETVKAYSTVKARIEKEVGEIKDLSLFRFYTGSFVKPHVDNEYGKQYVLPINLHDQFVIGYSMYGAVPLKERMITLLDIQKEHGLANLGPTVDLLVFQLKE